MTLVHLVDKPPAISTDPWNCRQAEVWLHFHSKRKVCVALLKDVSFRPVNMIKSKQLVLHYLNKRKQRPHILGPSFSLPARPFNTVFSISVISDLLSGPGPSCLFVENSELNLEAIVKKCDAEGGLGVGSHTWKPIPMCSV